MSLVARLTLSLAALLLGLGVLAFVGLRALTDDLTTALGESAASVSRSVVTVLRGEFRSAADDPSGNTQRFDAETIDLVGPPPIAGERRIDVETHRVHGPERRHEIRMVVDGKELSADEIRKHLPQAGADRATDPVIELHRGDGDGPPMLWLRGPDRDHPIALPQRGIDTALQRFQRQLGWGLALLLAVGIAAAAWLARRLARPLATLTDAAEAVGGGALGVQVPERGPPELRRSLVAFNRMSADLQRLDREASAARADRELAELGEIGRGLAHSLRNPLHALGLSLEALAGRLPQDPEVDGLAAAGREQLTRIDQALRGFLALAAGVGATTEAVALADVVDDVLLEASQRAQGRVRLVRDGATPSLIGVPAELRILIHSLVINALEASPDGGEVRVHLAGPGPDDGAATVTVEDSGPGIPEAIRPRLYAPHVSSKPTGAGMGLYLAQRLCRLRYGGEIELADRAPRGTRATLHLRPRQERADG